MSTFTKGDLPEYLKKLEAIGERRDFEVVIRAPEGIQLDLDEISAALYAAIDKKSEALEEKPYFLVEASTYSFNVRGHNGETSA